MVSGEGLEGCVADDAVPAVVADASAAAVTDVAGVLAGLDEPVAWTVAGESQG
jgi:hypothetical protein